MSKTARTGENSPLKIGKIMGAHGIKGYVNVCSYTETNALYDPQNQIELMHPGGRREPYTIRDCKPYRNILRIALSGVADRTAAEGLQGAEIFVNRHQLPEIEEPDSWYWSDLIGLEVYDIKNAYIGRLEHIFSAGGNDVFVVKRDDEETLIPAAASIVRCIDPKSGQITVDLPEGL